MVRIINIPANKFLNIILVLIKIKSLKVINLKNSNIVLGSQIISKRLLGGKGINPLDQYDNNGAKTKFGSRLYIKKYSHKIFTSHRIPDVIVNIIKFLFFSLMAYMNNNEVKTTSTNMASYEIQTAASPNAVIKIPLFKFIPFVLIK